MKQETAQWLGGSAVPAAILKSLGVADGKKPVIVINTTMYDGCLERVCYEHGIPVISMTDTSAVLSFAASTVGQALLEAPWVEWAGHHSCSRIRLLNQRYSRVFRSQRPQNTKVRAACGQKSHNIEVVFASFE